MFLTDPASLLHSTQTYTAKLAELEKDILVPVPSDLVTALLNIEGNAPYKAYIGFSTGTVVLADQENVLKALRFVTLGYRTARLTEDRLREMLVAISKDETLTVDVNLHEKGIEAVARRIEGKLQEAAKKEAERLLVMQEDILHFMGSQTQFTVQNRDVYNTITGVVDSPEFKAAATKAVNTAQANFTALPNSDPRSLASKPTKKGWSVGTVLPNLITEPRQLMRNVLRRGENINILFLMNAPFKTVYSEDSLKGCVILTGTQETPGYPRSFSHSILLTDQDDGAQIKAELVKFRLQQETGSDLPDSVPVDTFSLEDLATPGATSKALEAQLATV